MKYKLELTSPPGDKQQWLVRGLVKTLTTNENNPDWMLFPGLFRSCYSSKELIEGLHKELYGLLQTHGDLRDGDEFVSEECTVNRYHHHDASLGKFTVPALRFVCEGIHVENRTTTTTTKKDQRQMQTEQTPAQIHADKMLTDFLAFVYQVQKFADCCKAANPSLKTPVDELVNASVTLRETFEKELTPTTTTPND